MLVFVLITLSVCFIAAFISMIAGLNGQGPELFLVSLPFVIMLVLSIIFTAIKLGH